jgi:thioredoxin 1
MSRNLVIGVAVAAAVVLVLVFRPSAASPAPVAPVAVVSHTRPRLLDLGATTCIPCKAMVPVLEGLRADYAGKLDVEFIDIWKNREAGEAWHVEIMPTQVFIAADGRELARHEGFISREDILAQWQKLGVALE